MLINVFLPILIIISSQFDLIVAIGPSISSSNQSVQLLQQSANEIDLTNGLTSNWINSTIPSNSVNYTSSWLMGDNLRCSLRLTTDYGFLDNDQPNPINQLIVWYETEDSSAIQLWMDSNERLDLFSREYSIDLPLIKKLFRLSINFQSIKSLNYDPQLIKSLEIDRCWHTYQACPVLSCLTNGSHNGVSCTFTPSLSFNCSTSGLCIHRDEVCDFELNCPDGSDEVNCDPPTIDSTEITLNVDGSYDDADDNYINWIHNNSGQARFRCSFEVDYCLWKPTIIKPTSEPCFWGNCSHEHGLRWTVASHSLTSGPTFDHTLGTSKGHYLLLKSVTKLGKSTGSIKSTLPIGGHCKLIFYYLTNSRSSQVLVKSSDNSSSLNPFSTIEVVDLDWEKSLYTQVAVEIDLGQSGEWLFLVAMVRGDENSHLAIDDVYFTEGCYPITNSTFSSSSTVTIN